MKQQPAAAASKGERRVTEVEGESLYMDDPVHGVQATIIDLGLARIDSNPNGEGQTYWTHFDAEIFEGEGE